MLEIDQDFISHIVRNGNLKEVLSKGVKAEDFMDEGRVLFRALLEHYETYGTCPDRKTFRSLTDKSVVKLGPGSQPLAFYIDKITERRCQLLVIEHNERLSHAVSKGDWKGAAEVIYRSSAEVLQVAKPGTQDVFTLNDLVRDRIESYKRAHNSEDGVTGYRFPWPTLNQISGGFHPTDYVLFAGETGVGKSFLMSLLINSFIDQGMRLLVVSKEMPNIELQTRVVCVRGKFNLDLVNKGRLPDDERRRYFKFEKTAWKDADVHFAAEGAVEDHDDLKVMVKKYKPHAVLVDGVYLLAKNSKAPYHERVTEASTAGRMICLNEGVLGCDTSQLLFEKGDKDHFSLADLADAKKQARNATHVFFLTRNQKLRILKRAQILNLKARKGRERCVEVNWDVENNKWDELKSISVQVSRNGRKATVETEDDDGVDF